jgi:hypothetical protein
MVARNDQRPELRGEINRNAIAALTGILQRGLAMAGGKMAGLGGVEELEILLQGVREEIRGESAWWGQEIYVVVGKKPVIAKVDEMKSMDVHNK